MNLGRKAANGLKPTATKNWQANRRSAVAFWQVPPRSLAKATKLAAEVLNPTSGPHGKTTRGTRYFAVRVRVNVAGSHLFDEKLKLSCSLVMKRSRCVDHAACRALKRRRT
jgi:hypothetical protein